MLNQPAPDADDELNTLLDVFLGTTPDSNSNAWQDSHAHAAGAQQLQWQQLHHQPGPAVFPPAMAHMAAPGGGQVASLTQQQIGAPFFAQQRQSQSQLLSPWPAGAGPNLLLQPPYSSGTAGPNLLLQPPYSSGKAGSNLLLHPPYSIGAAGSSGCSVTGFGNPAAAQVSRGMLLQQQQRQQQQLLRVMNGGHLLPRAAGATTCIAGSGTAQFLAPPSAVRNGLQQQQPQPQPQQQQDFQQQTYTATATAAAALTAAATGTTTGAGACRAGARKRGRKAGVEVQTKTKSAPPPAAGPGLHSLCNPTAIVPAAAAAAAADTHVSLPSQHFEETTAAGSVWQLSWDHSGVVRSSAGSDSYGRGEATGQDVAAQPSAGAAAGAQANLSARAAAAAAAAADYEPAADDDSEVDETGMTIQEKNRSAQRRFRQRQKHKMASLENDVSRLSAALAAASCENKSMSHMITALERALVVRDEHIAGLQEALGIFSRQGIGHSTTAAAGAAPTGDGSTQQQERQLVTDKEEDFQGDAIAAAAAAGSSAATADKCSEAVMALAGGAAGTAAAARAVSEMCDGPPNAAAQGAAAAAAGDGDALSPESKPLTQAGRYTAEVVASMSPADVISEYGSLVGRVRRGLAQLEQPDAPPAVLQSIQAAMLQKAELCMRVAFYKPRAMIHLVLTNLETHAPAEVDVTHWRAVVPSLFLSEAQVNELLPARRRFLADMSGLLAGRVRVRDLMNSSLAAARATHIDVLTASLSQLDARQALDECVHTEHVLHTNFFMHMFKQVMSPLQAARCMVAAWPYYPDPLAITNVLQEQQDSTTAAAAELPVRPP